VSFRRFFLVRLAWALLGLWFVATAVFVIFFVAAPDPRARCAGVPATQGCIEFVEENYHLGSPRYEQYGFFLWRLVADQSTGRSFTTLEEAGADAREAIPASLSLVVPALMLAAGVGVLAGRTLARVRRRRILDLPIYVGVGLSPIFLGLLLMYYVGFRWDLIPIGGYCDFFNPPQPQAFEPKAEPCGGAVDWATHLVLPVITLSVYFAAIYTRVVRALVLESRSAKEPEERRNRRRRSALLLARFVGRDFGFALGVAMFVEVLFGIPGLGAGAVASVYADDHIDLQAYVLYATFLAVAVHFVVDVVVGALDPGLRWERPVARRPKPA
jgi:peptide/nickel transport system permease protein